MKKIIGIGNALTDVLVSLQNDEVLNNFSLERGSMSLMDEKKQSEISAQTSLLAHTMSVGGSAANTIRAMARLGSSVGFIGKVGEDSTGDFFEKTLRELSIEPKILRTKTPSGRCLSLISPDGERTMATYLGAALEMTAVEISSSFLSSYDCLYVEGYLVQNHELIAGAAALAKSLGLSVAIDMASFNVVEENLDFLRSLVANHVDIIFANEQEAEIFTGESDPEKALDIIAENCEIAIVKIGKKGALIKRGDEVITVGVLESAKRVDTTGAGDFYAAGFLWALTLGMDLRQCASVGSIVAGAVIEVVGTTVSDESWQRVEALVEEVKQNKLLF